MAAMAESTSLASRGAPVFDSRAYDDQLPDS